VEVKVSVYEYQIEVELESSAGELLQNRNRFIFLTWFGRFLTSPNSSLGKIFDIAGRFLTSSKDF